MEILMTNKRQNDFEGRFFDLLQEKVDSLDHAWQRIEKKLDKNTDLTKEVKAQAEKTNGRVTELEKEVFNKVKPQDLPSTWKDPKVLQIVLYLSLAFLLLVAAVTKFDIGGLI